MTILRDLVDWPDIEPKATEGGVEITCARCRKVRVVAADEPIPTYCSPTCRTKAYRKRKKHGLGVGIPDGPICPHPTKAAYPNEAAAEGTRKYRFPRNPNMTTYQCRCGSWHIGHKREESA